MIKSVKQTGLPEGFIIGFMKEDKLYTKGYSFKMENRIGMISKGYIKIDDQGFLYFITITDALHVDLLSSQDEVRKLFMGLGDFIESNEDELGELFTQMEKDFHNIDLSQVPEYIGTVKPNLPSPFENPGTLIDAKTEKMKQAYQESAEKNFPDMSDQTRKEVENEISQTHKSAMNLRSVHENNSTGESDSRHIERVATHSSSSGAGSRNAMIQSQNAPKLGMVMKIQDELIFHINDFTGTVLANVFPLNQAVKDQTGLSTLSLPSGRVVPMDFQILGRNGNIYIQEHATELEPLDDLSNEDAIALAGYHMEQWVNFLKSRQDAE